VTGRVASIDPLRPDDATLGEAAAILRAGGVVAFPTETFYGLGAAALNRAGVDRVFALKGRPRSSPLLVLVDSVAMAERIADVTGAARNLMARHWPGALTLVLRARPVVPLDVTASTATVGVRLSSHAVARELVRALGDPITAPSANVTGEAPPRTAAEVLRYFGDAIDLVLDGGETSGGLPSTVLDVSVDPPRLIRAGAITL
jgi:L-threonylcarbamoyladenylate synthase